MRDRAPRLTTVLALAFMLGLGLVMHLRLHPLSAPVVPLIAPNNTGADAVITLTPATGMPLPSLPTAVCAARAKQGAVTTKEDFIALLDTSSDAYQRAARPFRFIEVGANDGVRFSDRVMGYVDRYAWTGVLLEPVPGHFHALRKAYAKLVAKGRQLVFLNHAISDDRKPLVIYSAGPPQLLGSWARGVFSVDKAHVQKHLDWYLSKLPVAKAAQIRKNTFITSESVQATTFDAIRREHRLPSFVEYLQIDVEGMDLAMLRSYDLQHHGALFLQYEWAHLGPERNAQAIDYVRQAGYNTVVTGGDVVAVNEHWLREGCATHS